MKQPDFSRPFELHTDAATKFGIAVVLSQRYNNISYPLSFASRSVNPQGAKYSVQQLEALALVWSIKKSLAYLFGAPFIIYTDHSSLQWLLQSKEERQGRLARWALSLQAFSFKVIYIPGPQNKVADALSRDPFHSLGNISVMPTVDWSGEQAKDQEIKKLILKVQQLSDFVIEDQVLFKMVPSSRNSFLLKCIMVPQHMIQKVIQDNHGDILAGHFGVLKTISRIQRQFF